MACLSWAALLKDDLADLPRTVPPEVLLRTFVGSMYHGFRAQEQVLVGLRMWFAYLSPVPLWRNVQVLIQADTIIVLV